MIRTANTKDIPEIMELMKSEPCFWNESWRDNALDERQEIEAGNKKGIPLEHVKRELEKKLGPFDEEEYRKQVDEERLEKERIHSEAFIGTPTLKELIKKMYSDYQEYIQRDRAENP